MSERCICDIRALLHVREVFFYPHPPPHRHREIVRKDALHMIYRHDRDYPPSIDTDSFQAGGEYEVKSRTDSKDICEVLSPHFSLFVCNIVRTLIQNDVDVFFVKMKDIHSATYDRNISDWI